MRSAYTSRRDTYTNQVRRFRRGASFLSRSKRLTTYSLIGYTVFDPTVGVVLVPLFIGLLPVTLVQSWCVRRWQRAASGAAFYVSGLRRLDHQWHGRGVSGERYVDPSHAYASDLDLFGRGSLYELLCTAKTRVGQDTLAEWLLNSAEREVILERQLAISELRDRVDLRETIVTVCREGQRVAVDGHPASSTVEWVFRTRREQLLSFALVLVLIASTVGAVLAGGGWGGLLAVALLLEVALYHIVRSRLHRWCQSIRDLKGCLWAVGPLANVVRRNQVSTPLLSCLQSIISDGTGWSSIVRWVVPSVVLHEPVVLLPLVQLLPWLERLHARAVAQAMSIVGALGQFETLSAIATYAFERPQDVFAEIVPTSGELRIQRFGHPLLPEGVSVRNDVCFKPPLRLMMISGSNMSGKTTLMRSVGLNVVLAFAGIPVRADRMALSPCSLGTAIRFADSLHQGTSHFAAVVQRMKQIIDLHQDTRPLLYLFDEILQGTNSQDRRIGAEAVLRKLVDAGALGIVSTHDLALTQFVDELQGRAVNMHFADQLIDGQLTFDYQLRPGIVQSSNALNVMRSFGLDVSPS